MRLMSGILATFCIAGGVAAAEDPPIDPTADQGWSAEIRELFYHAPQGSQMIPAPFFLALERADGQGPFSDPEYLAGFGFLPADAASKVNPRTLPVGFALDPQTQQVGLTCAACHTADATVEGRTLRIEGAPSHLDFDTFYAALNLSVQLSRPAPLGVPGRFERLAAALGKTDPAEVQQLGAQFTGFAAQLGGDAQLRRPVLPSGPGRVDALTQIVNALAVRDQMIPANLYPVASPTSYPALWLTPHLEFVQWNPIAASPIARNGGQVLGVFGHGNLRADAGAEAFASTIRLDDLAALEEWLKDLAPPKWDEEVMGPLDQALVAEGETLFEANCKGCHGMYPYDRTDPAANIMGKTFIKITPVGYKAVGTDPAYVENLLGRMIFTNPVTSALFDGAPLVPAIKFFGGTVQAVLHRSMTDAGKTEEEQLALHGFRFHLDEAGNLVPDGPEHLDRLKAGPLAGIWATGPYLHNGSVPTVYELLSPPEERRAVFWTGGHELDLMRLGYQSGDVPGRFRFDTSLRGNGNQGHAFPPEGLSHDQRMAIIEYLKTK